MWYKSNQIKKHQRIRKYIVATDLTEGKEEFSCICGKFNKDGILCAHILKVIVEEEINKIPEKYFIDRWRKKILSFTLLIVQAQIQLMSYSDLTCYPGKQLY